MIERFWNLFFGKEETQVTSTKKPVLYISAPFSTRQRLRLEVLPVLREHYDIKASWLYEDDIQGKRVAEYVGRRDDQDISLEAAGLAERDIQEIEECDVFYFFDIPGRFRTTGRYVELGVAIALGKSIVYVGKPSSVFGYLTDIEAVSLKQRQPWGSALWGAAWRGSYGK